MPSCVIRFVPPSARPLAASSSAACPPAIASAALAETPAHAPPPTLMAAQARPTRYCKRVIACMDVRANDAGDLVCTKGDQYDVREKSEGGQVRRRDVEGVSKRVRGARRRVVPGGGEWRRCQVALRGVVRR